MAMNTQLVDAIIQMILALPTKEQTVITEKLFSELSELPEPSTQELAQLSMQGNSFRFLENEPDLYTLDDGEPIS